MNRDGLLRLNAAFLFLMVSMYLGTGWSMILFSFPVVPQLTPANYYLVFVPEVDAATRFFTLMTKVMSVSALIMIWGEWHNRMVWVPIVVLLSVIAATWLTVQFIFPYNAAMTAGIKDQQELGRTLGHWMTLNRVRVGLWTVQWGAMMFYFARRTYDRPHQRVA
jgi:hypothetical protein